MNTSRSWRALLLFVLFACTGTVWAQGGPRPVNTCFDDDPNTPCTAQVSLGAIPFDILPPGARALGLGGAFAAVADDATAAEANPAGQTILTRPEISIHGRRAEYETPIFDVNALDGPSVGAVGFGPGAVLEDSNTRPSFASFVYPFERFVLSAYYHNAGKIDAQSVIGSFDATFIDTYAASTFVDVEQDSFGISGAFRVNDMISIGASIKRVQLDVNAANISAVLDFSDVELRPGVGGSDPFADSLIINEVDALALTTTGDDSDITWNAGVLINPNGKFSAGIVYKEGGEFEVDSSFDYINIFDCNGLAGCNLPSVNDVVNLVAARQSVELPDILTVGVAMRPTDTTLVSLQFDRVDYGDQSLPLPSSFIYQQPAAVVRPSAEVNVHAGVEKTFLFDQPVLGMGLLSVRAGAFNDRDHDGYAAIRSNEVHYTFGLGTVFGENFQVDLAGEWSDKIDNVVLSGVYRF
jgi:hypothetical protein